MRELPKHVKENLRLMQEYAVKAEQKRIAIEEWFQKQGLKRSYEYGVGFDEHNEDTPITDILIDTMQGGGYEDAIYQLEKVLDYHLGSGEE